MGAINSAFNQAVGAAAGAALAVKHAKESDLSKAVTAEHSALIANNQAVDAEAAAKDAEAGENATHIKLVDAIGNGIGKDTEYYKAEEEYNKVKKEHKGQKEINAALENATKKLNEWEAAKRAIDELSNKIEGIQAMKQRAKDQRAYADKASQIASKAQQKYQSRWGGK